MKFNAFIYIVLLGVLAGCGDNDRPEVIQVDSISWDDIVIRPDEPETNTPDEPDCDGGHNNDHGNNGDDEQGEQ